ncbi:MAG TPA: hypothetical protein VK658_00275 [Chryseolinea sp.]|nr:hypothetical protein [Chryseolinea sp.]
MAFSLSEIVVNRVVTNKCRTDIKDSKRQLKTVPEAFFETVQLLADRLAVRTTQARLIE